MSLVHVRSSSLADVSTSGPGPGAGAGSGMGPGAGLGRATRSSLGSPLSSPLDSPLDSPLGSPLGAVSLDAAVFVAKGGLDAAMQHDTRTDTFADACGLPSESTPRLGLPPCPPAQREAPPQPPADTPSSTQPHAPSQEPDGPAGPPNQDADEGATEKVNTPRSPCGSPSRTTSSASTDSPGSPSPPSTQPARICGRRSSSTAAREGPVETRGTRSRELKEPTTGESAPAACYETRATRARRTRQTSVTETQPPEPPDEKPESRSATEASQPHASASTFSDAGTGAAAEKRGDGEPPRQTPDAPAVKSAVTEKTPASEATPASTGCTASVPASPAISSNAPSDCAPGSAANCAPAEATPSLGGPACAPHSTPATSTPTAPAPATSTPAAPAPATSTPAAPAPATSTPATSTSSATPSPALVPANGEGSTARSTPPTTPLPANMTLRSESSAPRVLPSATAVPAKRPRLTTQMSTEVTDSLGRKLCLLPSLPTRVKTTTSPSTTLAGGILSRALSGGLGAATKTSFSSTAQLVKTTETVTATYLSGRTVHRVGGVQMGILARTLSAPAALLPTSTSSDDPLAVGATTPTTPSLSVITSLPATPATTPSTILPPTSAPPCTTTPLPMTSPTTCAPTTPQTPSQTILLNPILSKALSPTGRGGGGGVLPNFATKPVVDAVLLTGSANNSQWPVTSSTASSDAEASVIPGGVPSLCAVSTAAAVSTSNTVVRLTACLSYKDAPRLRTRSINTTSTSNTSASASSSSSTPCSAASGPPAPSSPSAPSASSLTSLALAAPLRRCASDEEDTASKTGLSDSCASNSSLSTATSPGTSCTPCIESCIEPCIEPCMPSVLGLDRLDGMAAPELASAAPLFADAADDLIDVADALNALGAGDDDAVGSSQDSTQLSGGSNSSSSCSCCSGTTNFSTSSVGSCSGNRQHQRPRPASPSRLGPQQCQVCSKVFSNASALAKHKLTHSDERRYVCTVCCKAFKRQDHLNGHKLTHRNKKPYECVLEGCNKSYCDARSLRRHEENHHHLKGLAALKDKGSDREIEKEVRRKNSKTILSLLSTGGEVGEGCAESSDCGSQMNDGHESGSPLGTVTSSTPTASTTSSPKRSVVATAAPAPVSVSGITEPVLDSPQARATPKVSTAAAMPKVSVAPSPQFSSAPSGAPSGAAAMTGVPSPLVIPSVPPPSTPPVSQGGSAATGATALSPAVAVSGTATSLASAVLVQTAVTQASPIRIPQVPTPSPITIPSVRPQLLTARVVPAKQQQPLQNTQFSLLIDQSIPQPSLTPSPHEEAGAAGAAATLSVNFVSSYLQPAAHQVQQVSGVQLAVSQAAAGLVQSVQTLQSQKMVVKSPPSLLPSVQPSPGTVPVTLSAHVSLPRAAATSPGGVHADQAPRMLPPVTWSHMAVTSTSGQAPALKMASPSSSQATKAMLVSTATPPPQRPSSREAAADAAFQFGAVQQVHLAHLPHVKGAVLVEQVQQAPHQTPSEQQQADVFQGAAQGAVEAKEYPLHSTQKQPVRPVPFLQQQQQQQQKKQLPKSGLVLEMPAASTSNCAPVSTPTTTTTVTTVTTTASTLALTLSATKPAPVVITSKGSTKTSTNTCSSGISSCKVSSTAHLGSVRDAQTITSGQSQRSPNAGIQDDAKNSSKAAAAAAAAAANSAQNKPVACNLCNRRFKNIPALNGHMRLHGGYFKKESESKRSDKRESTGPPLQTASVSVRQLIEEKIIQKRGGAIGRVALLAGRDSAVSSSSSAASLTSTATTSAASSSPSAFFGQSKESSERRRLSEQHEQAFRKASMSSESITTATVLQHHNYANSSFPTPPPSANASNTGSPPPAPPSPLTCASFLPLSPQSDGSEPHQLLIHSEDPLLSSTIKDITRKKIDLGSLTVLGSVLVERGGELHLIQAPTAIVQKLSGRNTKPKLTSIEATSFSSIGTPNSSAGSTNTSPYQMPPQYFKSEDMDDEVFLGPPMVPDSPLSLSSPAVCPTSTSPLSTSPTAALGGPGILGAPILGQNFTPTLCAAPPAKRLRLARPYPAHKSRLRSCRREAICSASMPFTPAPMLDPNRAGTGLIAHVGSTWHCSSTTTDGEDSCDAMAMSAPESDSFPHVNVGTRFQCPIPACDKKPYSWSEEPSSSQNYLLWEPAVAGKCTDAEVDSFLEFACCDAIPWGGRNQEYALHLLHMCDGDIQEAMVQLLRRNPILPPDHSLLSYNYGITELWDVAEMDAFVKGLKMHMKNWSLVAKEVGNKTAKECVQFYYLWKRLCPDEYNSIRTGWREKGGEKVGDDMNNNIPEDTLSKKVSGPWLHRNTKADTKSSIAHHIVGVEELPPLVCPTRNESHVKVNTCSDSTPRAPQSSLSSSSTTNNSPCQDTELAHNTNSVKKEVVKGVKLEPALREESSLNLSGVRTSGDPKAPARRQPADSARVSVHRHQTAAVTQNMAAGRTLEENEKPALSDVKREPWDFCVKGEVKQEQANTDFTDTKVFITEFDDVKLNHVSETSRDVNETVEEAPIIVTRSSHLDDDPNDQVKMEIESMMALHGIRMEDDIDNEAVHTDINGMHTIFKEEPQELDLDQTTVKDTCSSPLPAVVEEHVSTSSESRLFVCELADCSASFNSRAALNGHIRIHGYRKSPPPNVNSGSQRVPRQEYHCETCGKTFAKLKSRNAHMKTHKLASADLAETLAGRATGISSSADVPSASSGLTFSTCLNFGLSFSESETSATLLEGKPQDTSSARESACNLQESANSQDSSNAEHRNRPSAKNVPVQCQSLESERVHTCPGPLPSAPIPLGAKASVALFCTSSASVTMPDEVDIATQPRELLDDSKTSPTTTVTLADGASGLVSDLPNESPSSNRPKMSSKATMVVPPQKSSLKKRKTKSKGTSSFCSLGRVK